MKTTLIEPLLVVASSLLWVVVLPIAALVCSGIAISDLKSARPTWVRPETRASAGPHLLA